MCFHLSTPRQVQRILTCFYFPKELLVVCFHYLIWFMFIINIMTSRNKLSTAWLAGFLPPVLPCSILPLGTKTRCWQFYLQPETCGKWMFPNLTCAHVSNGLKRNPPTMQNYLPCLVLKPRKIKNPQVFVGRTPRLHCYQLCTPFQGWTPGVSFWHQKLGVGLSCNFNGCSKYCVYISGWWDMFEIGIFKLYLYTNVISFCLYVVFLLYHLPFEISDTASCGTTGIILIFEIVWKLFSYYQWIEQWFEV